MVIVNDATVGADRDVNARLFEIFISLCTHFHQSSCLSTSDALGLAGDADAAAADADLDEVRAAVCQETESVCIDHVACADLDAVAICIADPFDRDLLPCGKALGRVDAKHICACVQKGRNPFSEIPGIDAGSDHVTFGVV